MRVDPFNLASYLSDESTRRIVVFFVVGPGKLAAEQKAATLERMREHFDPAGIEVVAREGARFDPESGQLIGFDPTCEKGIVFHDQSEIDRLIGLDETYLGEKGAANVEQGWAEINVDQTLALSPDKEPGAVLGDVGGHEGAHLNGLPEGTGGLMEQGGPRGEPGVAFSDQELAFLSANAQLDPGITVIQPGVGVDGQALYEPHILVQGQHPNGSHDWDLYDMDGDWVSGAGDCFEVDPGADYLVPAADLSGASSGAGVSAVDPVGALSGASGYDATAGADLSHAGDSFHTGGFSPGPDTYGAEGGFNLDAVSLEPDVVGEGIGESILDGAGESAGETMGDIAAEALGEGIAAIGSLLEEALKELPKMFCG